MAWTPVFFHQAGTDPDEEDVYGVFHHPAVQSFAAEMVDETQRAISTLLLTVPDFTWTIEVDLLGKHRITLYFKGATISVDAMQSR